MRARSAQNRLERLRAWRNAPERDLSLADLQERFRKQVEKPYRQLASLTELWREEVPAHLTARTRLDGFQRGVLRVSVDSSAALFELDRLLRSGVERRLIERHGGSLRRVRLQQSRLD